MFRSLILALSGALAAACIAQAHPAYDLQVAAHDVELIMSAPRASAEATEALKAEVAQLQARGVIPADIDVLVLRNGPFGQVLNRELLVLSGTMLKDLSSNERVFVLAHEASHLKKADRESIRAFIADRIPSYVPYYELPRRSQEMAPELRSMRHAQELQADAFGYEVLRSMGLPAARIIEALFSRYPDTESGTHPAMSARLQQIRTLCKADRSC